jgi:hypothetical protein
MAGIVVERFGQLAGLLSATAAGLLTVSIVSVFMPETKPLIPSQGIAAGTQNFARWVSPSFGEKVHALLVRDRRR